MSIKPPQEHSPGIVVATYDYRDVDGDLIYQTVRWEPKAFSYRRPPRPDDPPDKIKHGWVWSLALWDADGNRLPYSVCLYLYRYPEIIAAIERGDDVWIPEGEKDANALVAAGAEATCNPMGAGKWKDEYTSGLALEGVLSKSPSRFVVVVDRDDAGMDHARDIAESFDRYEELAGRVRFVQAAKGSDAADHLALDPFSDDDGLGLDEFVPVEVEPRPRKASKPSASRVRVEFSGDRPSPQTMVQWGLARAVDVGSRNRATFDLAQQLNDNRFPREEAWAIGLEYLERANEELPANGPFSEAEVRTAFRDAYAIPPREPWTRRTHSLGDGAEVPRPATHPLADGWSS